MNLIHFQVLEGETEILNVAYRTPLSGQFLSRSVLQLLNQGWLPENGVNIALYEISELYRPLASYLGGCQDQSVTLQLDEIESILGGKLPASALNHNAWWSNSEVHTQAKSWLHVGWRTKNINLKERKITFYRTSTGFQGEKMYKTPEPKQMTISSVSSPKVTPNGNRYLECDTSVGKIAVWGSSQNDTNIRALLTNPLPIEVIALCIPGRYNHVYWVPETTSLFLAARPGPIKTPISVADIPDAPF